MSIAFRYREQDQVFACNDGSHWLRIGYLGGSHMGCRKHICTSFLFFLLLLVILSPGIREGVRLYQGTALATTRVVMPITFH